MPLPQILSSLPSAALADALVASIWQGLLLTVCVAFCLQLLPGLTAAARSAIWTVVLLSVVISPLLPMAGTHGAGQGGALHFGEAIAVPIVCIWAVASLFRAAQLLASAGRLSGLRRGSTRVEASERVRALLRTKYRLATLCTSTEVDRPSVAGFFRPQILLPSDLIAALSEDELSQIVLHEMEHLRRYDDWTNLLQQVSLVLLPLNPVLPWLNRRLCLERELACDDGVLETTRARKAYAACLARVAENSLVRKGLSLALGALGDWRRRSELSRRVERILSSPSAGLGRRQLRFATGSVLASVVCGALLLAHSPRLVSFGPVGQAQVFAESEPAASVQTVRTAEMSRSLVHPTYVKAVMPAAQARPVLGISGVRHAVVRASARRRVRVRRAPMLVMTDWRQAYATPIEVPAMVRLRSVVFDKSINPEGLQVVYTAVRWADGWLVVQL